jgi:hypothetical protein
MQFSALILAAVPASWLLANHYSPWHSAWQEGAALCLLATSLLLYNRSAQISRLWIAFLVIALSNVAAQLLAQKIYFGGDALMAALYLVAFGLAIAAGSAFGQGEAADRDRQLTALGVGLVASALVSTGIALAQWTATAPPSIWLAEMAPGGRPYGNVAQPNHLSTICMLGLVGAALLRQLGELRRGAFWVTAAWLLLGMVMSASRTGWVQVSLLILLVMTSGPGQRLALSRRETLALGAIYAACVFVWPGVNSLLHLQEGRTLADAAQSGTRLLHWKAMLDAVAREPWWGYGWQQVSVAQVTGAERHPAVGEYIEHTHNLALDLLVWNGVPIGATLILLLVWWGFTRLRTAGPPCGHWMMLGVLVIVAHALVEFPVEFAYFLIPLGLFIGAVDALRNQPSSLRLPAGVIKAGGLCMAVVLGLVGKDYLAAEQGHRLLRLESSRIGVQGLQTAPPRLTWLTQLGSLLAFAHERATPGMSTANVEWMRRVSERYAYPPVMLRYALAAGLNEQPAEAKRALQRLCLIHGRLRCAEAADAWRNLQSSYPPLRSIPEPSMP